MSNDFFKMRGIVKQYQMGNEVQTILKGIDLDIEEGEFLSILGPSGSGKSTLMNIIGCLDTPTSGEYILHGRMIRDLVLKNVRVSDKAAVRNNAHVQAVVKAVGEKLGDTGRVLLRESGTEPVIRVMAEAQEQRVAEACVNEMIDAIKAEGLA